MPEFRITDWDRHFENASSRKLKRLDWVPIPNKMDGAGYTALVDHANAAAHLGAWYAIVEIASRQEIRGLLPSLAGTCQCLSRMSRIPAEVFREVIPRLLEIGWLEEIKVLKQESPNICQHLPQSANESAESVATGNGIVLNGRKEQQPAAESTPLLDGLETDAKTPPDHPRVVRPAVQAATSADADEPPSKSWFDAAHLRWYEAFWNRKARGDSRKAYEKRVRVLVRKGTDYAGAEQFLMTAANADRAKYECTDDWKWRSKLHPATWLNGQRWEDEPSAPVNGSGIAPSRPSSTDAVRALAIRNLERTGNPFL